MPTGLTLLGGDHAARSLVSVYSTGTLALRRRENMVPGSAKIALVNTWLDVHHIEGNQQRRALRKSVGFLRPPIDNYGDRRLREL